MCGNGAQGAGSGGMDARRTALEGLELKIHVSGVAGGQENSQQDTRSVLLCTNQSSK